MAVEYVRRGEIYSVRMEDGYGSEQGVSRPALIISNDGGNNTAPTVVVAYLTTRDHNIGIHYGPTKATGRPSYIMCEQLATVDKRRLIRLMGSLSPNEMREVEARLDEALDMGYVDDTPLLEKEQQISALKLQMEELKSEVFRLKTSLSAKEDEILTRDVEIAVHKRMYEKAVGIIAAMRVEPDKPKPPEYVRQIEAEKKEDLSKPEPPKSEEPKEPKEPEKPDINTATFSQLRGAGFSNSQTLNVINGRPYKCLEDLKNNPGMTAKAYNILSKRVCCVPVGVEEEPPKVTAVEESVEENVQKVNVNTASAQEIHDVTGLSMNACWAITGKRKAVGRFMNLEELVIPNRLSAKMLEKYRDKMGV